MLFCAYGFPDTNRDGVLLLDHPQAKSSAEVARVQQDYLAQVSSLETRLADTGTEREQEASSRADSEAALQEVTRQLSEVQRDLDKERLELQGIKARRGHRGRSRAAGTFCVCQA